MGVELRLRGWHVSEPAGPSVGPGAGPPSTDKNKEDEEEEEQREEEEEAAYVWQGKR